MRADIEVLILQIVEKQFREMKISNIVSITSCVNAIPLHTFLSIRYAMETAWLVDFPKIPPAIADDLSDNPLSILTLANDVLPSGADVFEMPEQNSVLKITEDTTIATTTTTEWTTHPYVERTTSTLDFDHSTESGWSTSEPEWMSRHISIYGADAPPPYRPNEKTIKQWTAKATGSTPTQSTPTQSTLDFENRWRFTVETPYRPNEKTVKQRTAKATESTPTQSTPYVISTTCNIL